MGFKTISSCHILGQRTRLGHRHHCVQGGPEHERAADPAGEHTVLREVQVLVLLVHLRSEEKEANPEDKMRLRGRQKLVFLLVVSISPCLIWTWSYWFCGGHVCECLSLRLHGWCHWRRHVKK